MDKPDSSAFLSLLLQSSFMEQKVVSSNTEHNKTNAPNFSGGSCLNLHLYFEAILIN